MEQAENLKQKGFANLEYSLLDHHREDLQQVVNLIEKRKGAALFYNQPIFRKLKNMVGQKSPKDFLLELLKAGDYERLPFLKNIAQSPQINELVKGYLGDHAQLHGMGLWYSPANDGVKKSQMYHFDHGAPGSFVKIFILLDDVEDTTGPLTFLDAEVSEEAAQKLGRTTVETGREKKFSDEDLSTVIDLSNAGKHTGSFGAAYLVDPNRCLHQGARVEKGVRKMLMMSYSSNNDVNMKARVVIGY